MKRLLVTGIGRSGTAYAAALLNAVGVGCGHEHIYHAGTKAAPAWGNVVAESSWYAVPWLGELDHETLVIHLVRNPLDWLSSWVLTCWTPDRRHAPTTQYINRCTGTNYSSLADANVADAAMRLYIEWNLLAERRALGRVNVETISESALEEMSGWVGRPTTEARRALAETATDVNAREHARIDWSACKHQPHAKRFAALAERYGYPRFDQADG